eukprot:TRINITY_DN27332_c0_g1_i1.p3 TRINITY_DN27332_c0_g1~~TRINITY_DN27332_c0_g1_i1.p3  ORF type:complete len:101 (-),score=2.15 TRINITY_DN27332_c0_g1_i1:130-432(-)
MLLPPVGSKGRQRIRTMHGARDAELRRQGVGILILGDASVCVVSHGNRVSRTPDRARPKLQHLGTCNCTRQRASMHRSVRARIPPCKWACLLYLHHTWRF